ncbi:MAG: glycosyltransferase family 2 protein [Pyrinomonadaceae bacterium]
MQEKLSDCPKITERLIERRVGNEVSPAAPKVSVIIPAYDVAAYIEETLDSIFAQTFKDYEVILVNDGSTDTEELKAALAPYIEKIIYAEQKNSGASRARNAAICLSRGELLAFLDGDDVWFPDYLDAQINFLERENLEMVYCDALLFGEPLFAGRTFMEDSPSSGAVTTASLINADCNVITSGTIIRKNLLEKSELFDTDLPRMQDFDLWVRLAQAKARIGYSRDCLIKYRVRRNSLSGTNIDRTARDIRSLEVVRKKHTLDAAELKIWENRMARCRAELELEKGKLCLAQGDFTNAKAHIAAANNFYRKPKLSAINLLMRVSPRLTLKLFRALRPSEFSFISPDKF